MTAKDAKREELTKRRDACRLRCKHADDALREAYTEWMQAEAAVDVYDADKEATV